jgi:Tol biopolymer transport system component
MNVLKREAAALAFPPQLAFETDIVWSPDETALAVVANRRADSRPEIYLATPGKAQAAVRLAEGTDPAWSPDGRMIAFTGNTCQIEANDSGFDLMIANRDGTGLRMITPREFEVFYGGHWSTDGREIAFVAFGSQPGIYTVRPDGSSLRRVHQPENVVNDFGWTGDGSRLYFTSVGGFDVCLGDIAEESG